MLDILGPEAMQDHADFVGPVIAVRISSMEDMRDLRNVGTPVT